MSDTQEYTGAEPTDSSPLTLHTQVSEVPLRTPVDVRLGLTLLPARYLLRGLFKTMTDSGTPEGWRAYTTIPLREKLFAQPLFRKLEDVLAKTDVHDLMSNGVVPNDVDDIAKELRKTEAGKELKSTFRKLLAPLDAASETLNVLQYSILHRDPKTNRITLTDESKNRIRGHMSEPVFEFMYDNALGVGSLGMTYAIRQRVVQDMKSIYSEAVAYENGKDPSQITIDDIFNSNNHIIQSTSRNFTRKQNQRLGISAIPFLKSIPSLRSPQFGEFAIGAWGMLWAFDVWGREPTMLELFSDFVNDKLNPKFGIGDKVKSADIINLYQQYATKFHKDWAFQSVLSNDPAENRLWAQSEKIFVRIADLMNESYNYKHTTTIDPVTGLPEQGANFTLPKFIYLLGHGHINAHKPEWSIAYVEIADKFGMDAVKEVEQAQRNGKSLKQVLEKYPVELDPLRTRNGRSLSALYAGAEQLAMSPHPAPALQEEASAAPTHQVDAAQAHAERLHPTHELTRA